MSIIYCRSVYSILRDCGWSDISASLMEWHFYKDDPGQVVEYLRILGARL
jgi:hypothetical protein